MFPCIKYKFTFLLKLPSFVCTVILCFVFLGESIQPQDTETTKLVSPV